LFALEVFSAGEFGLLLVVGKVIVASNARLALLQAADGFVNLGSGPQRPTLIVAPCPPIDSDGQPFDKLM
jgi:hypothetical protein